MIDDESEAVSSVNHQKFNKYKVEQLIKEKVNKNSRLESELEQRQEPQSKRLSGVTNDWIPASCKPPLIPDSDHNDGKKKKKRKSTKLQPLALQNLLLRKREKSIIRLQQHRKKSR